MRTNQIFGVILVILAVVGLIALIGNWNRIFGRRRTGTATDTFQSPPRTTTITPNTSTSDIERNQANILFDRNGNSASSTYKALKCPQECLEPAPYNPGYYICRKGCKLTSA